MGVGYIAPFDFYKIFVNIFLGNLELFVFAFIILMSFIAAKFRMSNKIFFTLIAVGAIIFGFILDQEIYILIILIIGIITFKGVSRIVQ